MSKQINELIKSFVPEFGNENHINLPNLLNKLKELEKRTKGANPSKGLQYEIETLEKRILSIITKK